MSFYGDYYGWAPRKTVGQRRAEAAKMLKDAARRGRPLAPIVIEGRKIATTFWGKAWCDNLERYRDFAYRLERGRSYARSGSVIDLAITPGRVTAKVLGSELYDVAVSFEAVTRPAWSAIKRDCAGGIGSLVDLLAGTLSEAVMARLCAERTGLFPAPAAIDFDCSCPDYASMCKHVAAALYGVGARLDRSPELLFTLRKVTPDELIAAVARDMPAKRAAPKSARVLADDGALGAMFGIDLEEAPAPKAAAKTKATPARNSTPASRAARGGKVRSKPKSR